MSIEMNKSNLSYLTKNVLLVGAGAVLIGLSAIFVFQANADDSDKKEMTRADWKRIVKWDDECDRRVRRYIDADIGFVGVDVYKLKSGTELVSIVCRSAAYNEGVVLYQKPKGSVEYKLLEFPQIVPVDQSSKPIKSPSGYYRYTDRLLWGSTNIDTENEKISFRDYFRSGGGCGLYTEYKLADSTPVITLFRARNICDSTNPPIKKWRSYSNKEIASWPMGDVPER